MLRESIQAIRSSSQRALELTVFHAIRRRHVRIQCMMEVHTITENSTESLNWIRAAIERSRRSIRHWQDLVTGMVVRHDGPSQADAALATPRLTSGCLRRRPARIPCAAACSRGLVTSLRGQARAQPTLHQVSTACRGISPKQRPAHIPAHNLAASPGRSQRQGPAGERARPSERGTRTLPARRSDRHSPAGLRAPC